jgi:molybdate transport system substrate-binding protein
MRFSPLRRIALGFGLLLALPCAAPAADLAVAAAANLVYALDALNTEFTRSHADVHVTKTTGASGTLVTQIANGAPYDVFLSADLEFAQKLVQAGGASASSLKTFALGRLVIWSTRPDIDVTTVDGVIVNPAVHKLAIANPKTAPYGRAAMEAITKLRLGPAAEPKLVQGENISQTAEFVETGNADAGFVAMSLVLSPKLKVRGHWTEVPPGLYSPLGQAAVITRHGADNPAAQAYLDFLTSPAAGKILEQFGYHLPP